MKNKKLKELYEKNLSKNLSKIRKFKSENNLSSPLLMRLQKEKVKLFVVGQETYDWTGNSVEECQDHYEEVLTTCLKPKKPEPKERISDDWDTWHTYNSKFWATIRTISDKLKINSKKECVAWNNLNRMDEDGGPPSQKIKKQIIEKFPLLPKEIKICKPKLIIFFTHQRYDNLLEETFKKCNIEIKIHNNKVGGLPTDQLAKVTIPRFKGKAYRTWHPNYKSTKDNEKIINAIINDFEK